MEGQTQGSTPAKNGRTTEQGRPDVPSTVENQRPRLPGNAGYQPQHSAADRPTEQSPWGVQAIPSDKGSQHLWPPLREQFEDRTAAPIILVLGHKGSGKSFRIMTLIKPLLDHDLYHRYLLFLPSYLYKPKGVTRGLRPIMKRYSLHLNSHRR